MYLEETHLTINITETLTFMAKGFRIRYIFLFSSVIFLVRKEIVQVQSSQEGFILRTRMCGNEFALTGSQTILNH